MIKYFNSLILMVSVVAMLIGPFAMAAGDTQVCIGANFGSILSTLSTVLQPIASHLFSYIGSSPACTSRSAFITWYTGEGIETIDEANEHLNLLMIEYPEDIWE